MSENEQILQTFSEEKDYLLFKHTRAFYRILEEYSQGKMDRTMVMEHIRTYLKEWDKMRKRFKNG